MTTFYAQPYDISATGFYFENAEDFGAKLSTAKNEYGQPVEEFEIQFIDGEDIDAVLAQALQPHQGNIVRFMERTEEWGEDEKRKLIIAVGECGYAFDLESGDCNDFEVDLYEVGSMKALAEQFVDDGLFGDIPEHLANYIDYDAVARDLACDYSEIDIAGTHHIYRCG